MLPFRQFIIESFKRQGLTNTDVIKRLGYKNISKGVRRLETFLDTLEGPEFLYDALREALYIPAEQYRKAYEAQRVILAKREEQSNRASFRPVIQIDLKRVPSPIYVAVIYKNRLEIEVADYLHKLPFDLEIKQVFDMYRQHFKLYQGCFLQSDNYYKGFRYHRRYGETLVFDSDCRLLDIVHPWDELTRGSLKVGGKKLFV